MAPRASTSKQPYHPKRARTGSNATTVGRERRAVATSSDNDEHRPRQHSDAQDDNNRRRRTDANIKSTGRSLSLAGTTVDKVPDLTGISKLDLSNCNLTSLEFIRQAKDTLTWLNVSGNDLSAPDAFKGVQELKNLSVLNVSNCSLKSVPSCVSKLESLKAFVATHNSFRKLNHLANLPELNTIVVSHNKLESLPTELATLPSLKKISASHNRLQPDSLPDLSSLQHLKEIKFNDNPTLDSLPAHFVAWGKHASNDDANRGSDKTKHSGLEIVDLGNCGFKDWVSLRQLAAHTGIYNLVLKGNNVITEALADTSFDELKKKMLVLLPNLRVFDGQRFDAKFHDLKARRDARAPEDKVLDAGPMGLAINAAKDEPVAISHEAMSKRMRAKRDKLIEKRLKSGLDVRRDWMKEYEQRKGLGQHASGNREDEDASEAPTKKRKSEAGEQGSQSGLDLSAPKKKKKNRHEARRQAEAAEQAVAHESIQDQPQNSDELQATTEAEPIAPAKKSNKKHKATATDATAVDSEAVESQNSPAVSSTIVDKPKKNRHKKDKKPLLADLLGTEQDAAGQDKKPVAAQAVGETESKDEPTEPETKEKTSILKVVEVRKKEGKKGKAKQGAQKAAVESLLGLAPAQTMSTEGADDGGAQGLVGLGWD
ncbi:hypothetical protein ACM66B_001943 [Microbotryomycetes sp. NB124-2]